MSPYDLVVRQLTSRGQRFELVRDLVLGEPMWVFAKRQRSLAELLLESKRFGHHEYLVSGHTRMTFHEHFDQVLGLARLLREDYGIVKGDRVGICSANRSEWIIAFWATVLVGGVSVAMNSMWAAPEADYAIRLTNPKVVFVDEARRRLFGSLNLSKISIEDVIQARGEHSASHEDIAVDVDEDDPATILFTSGTSGRPKGVVHSHRNVISACWFHLLNDAIASETTGPVKSRRFLLATPLFHIAALHNLAVPRLAIGDTAVIHLGRFDVHEVSMLIAREGVTNWGAVPTMLSRLVEHPGLADYDLNSLRGVTVSSAPSSRELKEKVRKALPRAGPSLSTSYGLTESSTAVTRATPEELRADPQTVGKVVPTMQVEIRNSSGTRVADGREGEIHLRGPQMMLGYWEEASIVFDSFAPNRWFATGDIGVLLDGSLSLSSRRTDLILRGGENVYPAEVEEQIAAHSAVMECAVIGLPDEDLGQKVAAIVTVRHGATLNEEALSQHLATRLAKYKIPTRWLLTDSVLPRSAMGKIRAQDITELLDPELHR